MVKDNVELSQDAIDRINKMERIGELLIKILNKTSKSTINADSQKAENNNLEEEGWYDGV